MVFESVVVDLLNRLLGDYFENLDTSQLKLGIWGGDVVLRDLLLKASAIDDLSLPFKVVVGKLGILTMKIPWQSLYTAPVELNLKGLYLLVVPSQSVVYNADAEEIALQAAKQKEITRIEEARKKENLPKTDPEADTFAEKLITQIIKNVQISIESIHIRYEDAITKPNSPFGFGVILKSLNVQTTGTDWKPAIISEIVQTIHKMATLKGLSLYWNSNTVLFSPTGGGNKIELVEQMKEMVENKKIPLTYVLGPISSEAKVQLTPSPERGSTPFSMPKAIIDVVMQELSIGLTNLQFQDVTELAESIDFMTRAQYNRKYRPNVTEHKGNAKLWWKFAYRCVVEEDVRRRKQNWSWENMKRHRNLTRIYADAYYKKLSAKKPKADVEAQVSHCEKVLDVFNITLVRKQVELRIDREGKQKAAAQANAGWFSGWFGGSTATDSSANSGVDNIVHKFGEALTADEKKKLYSAIDYSEDALPLAYPTQYIEYILNFKLHRLKCTVRDSTHKKDEKNKEANTTNKIIMELVIADVTTSISTRPVKNGLQVSVRMGSLEAIGIQMNPALPAPHLITSNILKGKNNLFEIDFESHPLNSSADQKVVVSAQPLEVVYHAKTIVQLVDCFTLPPEIQLSKLQAATVATLNEWKMQSASGIQNMIEKKGELDINIQFLAPYVLIPQGGTIDYKNGSVLVLDLGKIEVRSRPRDKIENNPKERKHDENKQTEFLQSVLEKSYDSFLITLREFQVLLALPGEDYKSVLKKTHGAGHGVEVLQPLITSKEFVVQLDQCIVPDDPRLPKLKISAGLPLLTLDITENRLLELVKLLVTLPFPQSEPLAVETVPTSHALANNPALAQAYAVSQITHTNIQKKEKVELNDQFTNMVMNFSITVIKLRITRVEGIKLKPLADFAIQSLETKLTMKTFGTGIDIAVGGLTLCALSHTLPDLVGPLYLLKTPMTEGKNIHLLNVHMFSITPDCPPKFSTEVKQHIKADVTSLDIILHQEALNTILTFVDGAIASFNKALEGAGDNKQHKDGDSISLMSAKKEDKKQVSKIEATRKAVAKKHIDAKDILVKVEAHLDRLTIQLSTDVKNIVKVVLSKLDASFIQKPKKSIISMDLTELTVLNLDPNGFYKKIVTVEADRVVHVDVIIYDDATKEKNYLDMKKHDMKVKVETGSPLIVYLSVFIDEIMDFVNTFQAAKEAVIDASVSAAEAAKENVGQVYSGSQRILLDVELKAPRIIIPRNKNSSAAILADLGNLTLQNVFKKKQGEDVTNIVIIDEMRITLENMKMSRVIIDKETQSAFVQCLMLDPVSFRLEVLRNLSTEWYNEIPSIDIDGRLESAYLRVSSEDYEIFMACLLENVAGGAPPSPSSTELVQKPTPSIGEKKSNTTVPAERLETIVEVHDDDEMREIIPVVKEFETPYCNMKLNIVIGETGVVMYTGSSKLEGKTGLVERDKADAFADFRIDNISVALSMWSNNNMNCLVTIYELSLDDCRPGTRAITNLIQRKSSSSETVLTDSAIVRITYRTDAAGGTGTTLNIETTSLTFVLYLDYLFQITGFFTAFQSEIPTTKTSETAIKIEEVPSGPLKELTPNKITQESGDDTVLTTKSEPPFNVFFTMAETEVVLVETLDSVNTNALLLNCEVSVKYIATEKKSNMMGAINKVKLSTCTYNPETRSQSLAEVISPMSITVVMNVSEDLGTLIDLNISDIFIRLTAGTLELLIKISSGLTVSPEGPTELKELNDYTNLWDVKPIEEASFWFLKPDALIEVGQDALQVHVEDKTARLFELADDLVVKERLVLESGCIVITFETGVGTNTTPVFLLETDVDLQMFDWSQKLQIAGRLKLEAAYYNAVFGMWEFLIEPVETRHHGKVSHQPWELLFEYSTVDTAVSGGGDDGSEMKPSTSFMAISLQSHDLLELTITKTALEVINILTQDFNEAVKALVSQRDVSTSAYTIVNDCGSDIKLDFRGTTFALVRKGTNYDEALLKHGTSLNLGLAESYDMTKHHSSVLKEQEGRVERLLKIHIEEYGFTSEIPVNRAEKRYYGLNRKTEWSNSINYGILCDTTVKDCSKVVTIRGIVQVTNELTIPIDVYYMDSTGNAVVLAGTVEKYSPLNLPLTAIYTKSCELFFAPKGHTVSTLPYVWTTLMKDLLLNTFVTCRSREPDGGTDMHLKVVGEAKQALLEASNRKTLQSQCYQITLKPPLVLNNLLPVSLAFIIGGTERTIIAERGHSVQITNLEIGMKEDFQLTLRILNYDDQSWTCHIKMTKQTSELSSWCFQSDKNTDSLIYLGIHKELADDIITIHVYCPFWMINRTGLDLAYKAEEKEISHALHLAGREDPVMFSFRGKAFFAKKKASVRINDKSDWSEKFSLDVAGSAGFVSCKSAICDYQVGIEIVLSSWGLSKSIIFSPRFFLINQCSYLVYICEKEKPEEKIPMTSTKCIPFWPKSQTACLTALIEGTQESTQPFSYDVVHSTLLYTQNKYGGIHVDIHITEVSTVITFSEYGPGKAPVLIVNCTTDSTLEIMEKGVDNVTRVIQPGMSQLISWMDPLGERILVWSPSSSGKRNSFLDKLFGDGSGSYKWTNANGQEFEYHWVCFLDGLQRVLLFTSDSLLSGYLQSSREIEVPTSDYTVMLQGLGLSLVNNQTFKEVMYMRLASSTVAWEGSKPGKKPRFKPLLERDNSAIEVAYQNYLNEKAISSTAKSHLTLDGGIEIDFVDLKMYKPQQKDLRRVFQTGVWVHYKTFPHSTQFHAKFNHLQIDNQLPDCIFHIVLAPVPPPKSVSTHSDIPKPFAEVSIMQRMTAHSTVIQFKYFKVLIQEFHIRLDISFVNAIVELFSESGEKKLEHMVEYFTKDYEEACTTMDAFLARHIVSQGQKHFYDFLHFSPLKIHVSFSMGGATQLSNNFLNLLIQSLGVTLTEIQDVVFKLACLELQHMFLSGDQLYAEAYSHYSSQAIKQLYVLVLGLDVIGNPYGLFLGVTEGVEAFFYEPFQGAIQGPGEFAEGLALGVKSLVGHTLGGAAGAMSRITGTLGKGIAALTLDDEYQKKRRENLNKRQDVAEGLAQSGKGLVMGFFDGVTGVVTKPFKGAKADGVGGFFKGLGKGAIGLVARPTAGVVDFTSGTFDAVKKATSVSEEVRRMRPPRHIPTDSILQPYVAHEAEGMQLLNDLEKGKYTTTDTYIAHALVNPHGLFVLLLTNKRVFYLKKDEVFGGWGIQWSYIWEDLSGPPDIVEKGLSFKLKPRERKLLRSSRKEVLVPLYSPDVCTRSSYFKQWMLNKIESAMKAETGIVMESNSSTLPRPPPQPQQHSTTTHNK